MRWGRSVVAFIIYAACTIARLWRTYQEAKCKALEPEEVVIDVGEIEEAPKPCLHDWVECNSREKRNQRARNEPPVYARCSQCPAER